MKNIYKLNNNVLFYDDVLNQEDFELIQAALYKEPYVTDEWLKNNKWYTGSAFGNQKKNIPRQSLLKRGWVSDSCRKKLFESAKAICANPEKLYSSIMMNDNDPLKKLVNEIRDISLKNPDFIGVEGKDWDGLYLLPYKWENNTRLIWHNDSLNYVGAFAYYCHNDWKDDWGGQLLVKGSNNAGVYIDPIPNRLSLIKKGAMHTVLPITSNRPRYSISGFFFKWSDSLALKILEWARN